MPRSHPHSDLIVLGYYVLGHKVKYQGQDQNHCLKDQNQQLHYEISLLHEDKYSLY